jgi:hypothetical protein
MVSRGINVPNHFANNNGRSDATATWQLRGYHRAEVEKTGASTEKQLIENAAVLRVQADYFAINHCIFYLELGEVVSKGLKTFVRIPATRN